MLGNCISAFTRLNHLQRKLIRDENLRVNCTQSIEKTIEMGHATAVPLNHLRHDYWPW